MDTACLVSAVGELQRLETRVGGFQSYRPPFEVEDLVVLIEDGVCACATFDVYVKVTVGGVMEHVADHGATTFSALEVALLKALLPHFPQMRDQKHRVRVTKYEAQIPYISEDGPQEPIDRVRALVEFEDGQMKWCTQGVADDPTIAYWFALTFGLEWWLAQRI